MIALRSFFNFYYKLLPKKDQKAPKATNSYRKEDHVRCIIINTRQQIFVLIQLTAYLKAKYNYIKAKYNYIKASQQL